MADLNNPRLRSRRPHGWKVNVALLLFSMLAAILFVEMALQQFERFKPYPRYDVGERPNQSRYDRYVVDRQLGWRISPRGPEINAQGFRSRFDFNQNPSRQVIVVLGDSFTYGSGVPLRDTFGELIDSALTRADVYNLAVPGFGVDQIWLTLRHVALPLRPDLIVVGLCDCDFKRSQSAYRPAERLNKPTFKLLDGTLIAKTEADQTPQPFHFLERHSGIWEAGRLVIQAIGYHFPVGEWWTLNEAILNEMRADAALSKTTLLFLYIPTIAWRDFRTLENYMDQTRSNYIDLRKGAPPEPESLYLTRQQFPHLNKQGHQYVANRVLNWIRTSPHAPDVLR